MSDQEQRRAEDHGPFVKIWFGLWNWIDNRNIDLHAVLVFTLWMTYKIMNWAMDFAENHGELDGLHMAAIIGAVVTPWSAMQAAMFAFYANARK